MNCYRAATKGISMEIEKLLEQVLDTLEQQADLIANEWGFTHETLSDMRFFECYPPDVHDTIIAVKQALKDLKG
jgi:hypothetical protein